MDFFVQLIVLGLLLPAVVSAVLLASGWQAWRLAGPAPSAAWSTGWALAAGFVVSTCVVLGWPKTAPIATEEWLVWLALAAAIVGTVPQAAWARWWFAWPVRAALLAAMLYATAGPKIQYGWEITQTVLWFGGVMLLGVVLWQALDFMQKRLPTAVFGFVLALPVGLGGLALTDGGSAKLGQLSGVLGILLGMLFIAGLIWHGRASGAGPTALLCLVFGALLLNGHWYGTRELPLPSVLLFMLAPLCGLFAFMPQLRGRPWWQKGLAAIFITAVFSAIALGLSLDFSGEATHASPDYSEYE